MRKIVAGRLHGIHVTEANLSYHGSIALDPDHCEAAGNKNSGARISTYVILGESGSRCCILNGAAGRTCQAGDQIIICNSVYVDERPLTSLKPRILTFDQDNHIRDRLSYSVGQDGQGQYRFSILEEADKALAIPALVSRS